MCIAIIAPTRLPRALTPPTAIPTICAVLSLLLFASELVGDGDGEEEDVVTANTAPVADCQNLVAPQVVSVEAPLSKTYTPYAEDTEPLYRLLVGAAMMMRHTHQHN